MQTFNPERTMDRARKVLPEGGWELLTDSQRRLVLRSAWVMSEADGTASQDERTALDALAQFLALGDSAKASGITRADRGELLRDVAASRPDRSFARHLYAGTYLVGMSDGVLMDSERAYLIELAAAMALDAAVSAELERDLHEILYEELLVAALRNLDVSPRERKILDAARKLLGLSEEAGHRIEEAYRERLVRGDSGAY